MIIAQVAKILFMQDVPLLIEHQGQVLQGLAVPLGDGINNAFDIIIGHAFAGTLRPQDGAWRMDAGEDPLLAEKIGRFITDWMEKESVLPADHYTSAFPDLPERPSR